MWNSSFQARIGASSLSQRMQRIETSRNRCDFQGLREQIVSRLAFSIGLFFYFFFFRSEKCLKMIRNTAFPPFIPQGTVRKVFFFPDIFGVNRKWNSIDNTSVPLLFFNKPKVKISQFCACSAKLSFYVFWRTSCTILLSLLVTSWCWIPKKTS